MEFIFPVARGLPFRLLEPTMTRHYISPFVDLRVRRFREAVTSWRFCGCASEYYRAFTRGKGNELLDDESHTWHRLVISRGVTLHRCRFYNVGSEFVEYIVLGGTITSSDRAVGRKLVGDVRSSAQSCDISLKSLNSSHLRCERGAR